jgi:hypothetical protein
MHWILKVMGVAAKPLVAFGSAIILPLDLAIGKLNHKVAPKMWLWASCLKASPEAGEVNIGGVLMMGLSMVFVAIGFIFLPQIVDASSDLLSYVYSGNATITDATYTGYTSIVGITPLMVLVGFLISAVISGFLGIKVMQGSAEPFGPGSLIMSALGIVFIAIGLIVEPIALDGISSAYSNGGAGIPAAFTGFAPLLLATPMLLHIGYLIAAVFPGILGTSQVLKGRG